MTAKQRRPAGNGAADERSDAGGAEGLSTTVALLDPAAWNERAQAALDVCIARGLIFDVDTVRAEGPGEPSDPNAWGRLFSSAHRRGLIVPVDTIISTRRSRHSGLNRQWRATTWQERGEHAAP